MEGFQSGGRHLNKPVYSSNCKGLGFSRPFYIGEMDDYRFKIVRLSQFVDFTYAHGSVVTLEIQKSGRVLNYRNVPFT